MDTHCVSWLICPAIAPAVFYPLPASLHSVSHGLRGKGIGATAIAKEIDIGRASVYGILANSEAARGRDDDVLRQGEDIPSPRCAHRMPLRGPN